MSEGYVYILSDNTHPYLKIGRTTRIPEQRVKELNTTGMPGKLALLDSILVNDCEMAEAEIHRTLAKYRVRSDREFFDIPQAVASAYLRTFSKYSKTESLIAKEREEIQQYITDISLISISRFGSKLVELFNDLSNKQQKEFPERVRTAGPVLYESFRSNTNILAERSGTIVAISFNEDNIDAWSIGVGEYRFIFDGRKADAKLIKDFKKEVEKVLGLFNEMGRFNTLIGIASPKIDEYIAKVSDYPEKAKQIILSASNSPRFSDMDEDRLNGYALDRIGLAQLGLERIFLRGMLQNREKSLLNIHSSLYLSARNEIDNYHNQLIALDKIDALKEETIKPVLTSLCEHYELGKQAQDAYLSFIDGIDSLLKQVRLLLFYISQNEEQ